MLHSIPVSTSHGSPIAHRFLAFDHIAGRDSDPGHHKRLLRTACDFTCYCDDDSHGNQRSGGANRVGRAIAEAISAYILASGRLDDVANLSGVFTCESDLVGDFDRTESAIAAGPHQR
jgi:hypothetical protein